MDTLEIEKYLSQLHSNKLQNIGVFASDRLPTRITPSTAIVANTVPHTEGGEHWVAFYWDHENVTANRVEFFDSFGRPPYQPDYQQFMRRNSRCRFIHNKYRLQSYNTLVCGYYCLTYLYCRVQYNMNLNEFVSLFDVSQQHTSQNDDFVVQLFHKFYSQKKMKMKK